MNAMKQEMLRELKEHIIPFWQGLKDDVRGGYFGLLDIDLNLDRDAEKGCILNSRILWFFSTAARVLNDETLIPYAEHAYRFMTEHCVDREQGGVYWSCTCDGTALDTTKHTYNQAFAVYALAAYYRLSKKEEARVLAEEIVDIIETRCRDKDGYLEAFDRSFCPCSNEKLSENGVMATRTMNTMLHVFEGYSGLYEATGNERCREGMREILCRFLDKVYNPERHRQEVFFDREYRTLIDLTSYGHDIESAWLLDWGAGLLKDEELHKRLLSALGDMAENVYRKALSEQGLYNECERGINDMSRVWWVQAEGVLGFFNAWKRAPEKTYMLQAARDLWRFIREHMIDPRPGSEWYSQLDRDLVPVREKEIVEPWKCPYHNGRMCMEMIRRAEE